MFTTVYATRHFGQRGQEAWTDGHLAISYMLINFGDYICRVTEAHYVSILYTLMNGNMNDTIRERAVTLGHE